MSRFLRMAELLRELAPELAPLPGTTRFRAMSAGRSFHSVSGRVFWKDVPPEAEGERGGAGRAGGGGPADDDDEDGGSRAGDGGAARVKLATAGVGAGSGGSSGAVATAWAWADPRRASSTALPPAMSRRTIQASLGLSMR